MNLILDYEKPDFLPNRQLARRGKRLLNFGLDSLIATIVGSAAQVFTMIIFNEESFNLLHFTSFLLGGYFGYYILMEYFFSGKTIAKILTKTQTLQTDGTPITFVQACERTFVRLIPFEPFSIFFNDDNLCWHDIHSNTVVVQDSFY
jgi:uncharacterized RDD family membrane protein YckC